jgi:P-type conjugative transfer protein TrbJ
MKVVKICLILISCIYISKVYAFGAELVYDPWNYFETAVSAANSATQVTAQAKQLQTQLLNLKNYDGNSTQWSNIQQLLEQLSNTVSQGNALSYSAQNINQEFADKFPGYKPQTNYDQSYQNWSSTTMDTLRNILANAGLQANAFSNEQTTLDTLKNLSTSAQGRMQAVQVGNMIAAEQVGQMQKLRQLIISQTDAQNTYMAYKVQQQQAQQASADSLLNNPLPYPKYGTGHGFGEMPQLNH